MSTPPPASPSYAAVAHRAQPITQDQIISNRKKFDSNVNLTQMQNVLTVADIRDVSTNRKILIETDHSFSTHLDTMSCTNQKSSGRCWLFALLNLFRPSTAKLLNLKEFEFSQAHIHFWDKFERANHFLTAILETSNKSVDDRTIAFLLSDPIGDGGQWNMAINIIRKHGLMPKSHFPESRSSSATHQMNINLKSILRVSACEMRTMLDSGKSMDEVIKHKEKCMSEIWNMLCMHLGTPPASFDFQWKDKDDKFHRKGEMTPLQFAKEFVDIDYEDYICLVHDPRNPQLQTYTVEYLQNVIGGKENNVVYLNISIEDMKELTKSVLVDLKTPVWMGCDVSKKFDKKNGVWDTEIYEFNKVYGIDKFEVSKSDRLVFGNTLMTHAMLFTGCDVVEDGKVRRWRVENSWGPEGCGAGANLKGFATMNDSWFDEYVFEVAVPRKVLKANHLEALLTKPVVLPAWDPMGSLAKYCGGEQDEE